MTEKAAIIRKLPVKLVISTLMKREQKHPKIAKIRVMAATTR